MSPCPLCGSSNQRGLRFCVTCGHLLAGASPPAPTAVPRGPTGTADLSRTVPESPPRFSSAPPPPTPTPPPIAPVRVVELGASPAPAMQRLCSRCRGASEQAAQFCRFCGASLADAQAVPIQPSANPIAAAPGPPAVAPPPVAARAPVAPTAPPSAAPAAPVPAPLPPPASAVSAGTTRARLVLIARDGNEGPSYALGESTDIGRSEGNIVIAEDRYISPRHARVAMRGGTFFVRDLESTNGVFVRIPFPRGGTKDGAADGRQPAQATDSEQVLADQDLFLVGQQVLRFEVVKHADEGFGVASENGTLLFGTPAAPRYARLSQRTVEGVVRDVFHVKKTETVVGRESGDIVFSDDAFLSRRHAVVRVHGVNSVGGARSFTLADLGSSNGTFLQVREEVRLRHGDHFRIGQQLFRFDT
ncbi:MAG TPA: FHA domain-containing protein [Polyangiaceae bacterium]|nr:FHA domain-containing protein [Polyangiaceae bacterium]